MNDSAVIPLRNLERNLFRAWCDWLCRPNNPSEDRNKALQFNQWAGKVSDSLQVTEGPYFLEDFGIVDVIFTPYIERMAASLWYYKGYDIKDKFPPIKRWFNAMESRETYRGTQSDYHTHSHDLPPQMGGCYSNQS